MEAKGYEDRLKVYLRVVGDETLSQYPLCVQTVARQCVRFTEPSKQPGLRKSAANNGAFPTRDKLAHTPLRRDSTKSVTDEPSSPGQSQDYNFDFVFDSTDSMEFVANYLDLSLTVPACVVSVGKADTLTELASSYLSDLLKTGCSVTLSCESYHGDKVVNYGGAETVRVERVQEAIEVMRSAEMGQGKKTKDGVTVLTIMKGTECGLQLVEATSQSKLLDLLLLIITNSDSVSDLRSVFKTRIFDTLRRTLCYQSQIIVFGNVVPTVPHHAQAGWVVRLLSGVMDTKHRCVTFLVAMCLKEMEKLDAVAAKSSRMLEDTAVRQTDESSALAKERDELKAALKQQSCNEGVRISELIAKHRQELADLRVRQVTVETQLTEARSKIFALESDLESRANGSTTQFHFMKGVTEEDFAMINAENKACKAKIAELETVVAAFQKCVGRKTVSAEKETQAGDDARRPRQLAIAKSFSACVAGRRGKEHQGDRDVVATLCEQLRQANDEIATLRAQHRIQPPEMQDCSSEDDLRQSRALYHLLTEVWIYTDSAVRGIKAQFDRLFALMELRVADRDLKIARLEQAMDNTVNVRESGTRAEELEADLREMRVRLTTAEDDLRQTREIVKEETDRMKDEHKKRLAHLTDQCSNQAETVTRLRAELATKDSDLQQSLAQWETEKRELTDQLTELKELRKPLANPSKRK